ncbi:hypothetical protein N0V86_000809 [Didymella sp. IMI 355093]|nr:hypothetical protein N0V86_000809 [Didymella sp. IMI 355093]
MSSANPGITFAIRGTQALFAIIVFGLSCSLIKGHEEGTLPSTLGFAAFIGGLSFIAAILGIASHWLRILQGQLGLLVDPVVAGINLAGGILMAIKMKKVSCGDIESYGMDDGEQTGLHDTLWNEIICGGVKKIKGQRYPDCHYYTINDLGTTMSRCKMASADSAFMFLTAILVAGVATLGWMRLKRGC